jgi:phosphoadenosine phosphosulfate reductase
MLDAMALQDKDSNSLRALAQRAGRELEDAAPQTILDWAISTFGEKFCIAASMADAVLIDMATRIKPGIDVLFLDTGYHFKQTLATRDRVASRYPIKLHNLLPRQTVAEQDALFGPRLYDRDPDACCNLRKVEPLRRGLRDYRAWASGIRRDETPDRRSIGTVEWDANRSMVKVNPLATWTQEQVNAYILENDVEVNELSYDGYPSIGCEPCTRRVLDGGDARSGRWAGRGKTECGLHVGPS